MAENNLGSTQYFRTKPDRELEVKRNPGPGLQRNGRKKAIIL